MRRILPLKSGFRTAFGGTLLGSDTGADNVFAPTTNLPVTVMDAKVLFNSTGTAPLGSFSISAFHNAHKTNDLKYAPAMVPVNRFSYGLHDFQQVLDILINVKRFRIEATATLGGDTGTIDEVWQPKTVFRDQWGTYRGHAQSEGPSGDGNAGPWEDEPDNFFTFDFSIDPGSFFEHDLDDFPTPLESTAVCPRVTVDIQGSGGRARVGGIMFRDQDPPDHLGGPIVDAPELTILDYPGLKFYDTLDSWSMTVTAEEWWGADAWEPAITP